MTRMVFFSIHNRTNMGNEDIKHQVHFLYPTMIEALALTNPLILSIPLSVVTREKGKLTFYGEEVTKENKVGGMERVKIEEIWLRKQ